MRQRARQRELGELPSIPTLPSGKGRSQASHNPLHCTKRVFSLPLLPTFLNRLFHARLPSAVTPHAHLIQPKQSTPNQYSMSLCKAHSRHDRNLDGWTLAERSGGAARIPYMSTLTGFVQSHPSPSAFRDFSAPSIGAFLTHSSAPSCTFLARCRPRPIFSPFLP